MSQYTERYHECCQALEAAHQALLAHYEDERQAAEHGLALLNAQYAQLKSEVATMQREAQQLAMRLQAESRAADEQIAEVRALLATLHQGVALLTHAQDPDAAPEEN
jgi:vacuolar-type H+-ATPase subunit D/Vma8